MIKKLERNRVILEYGIYTTEITRFSKRRKKQKRCAHLHIKQGGEKNGAKYKGFVVHCFRTCSFFFFLETISEQLIWRTLIMAEKRMFNTKISLSLLECNGWFTIFFSFFIDTMTFIQRTEKEIEIRHVLIMKRSLRGNFFQFFYD